MTKKNNNDLIKASQDLLRMVERRKAAVAASAQRKPAPKKEEPKASKEEVKVEAKAAPKAAVKPAPKKEDTKETPKVAAKVAPKKEEPKVEVKAESTDMADGNWDNPLEEVADSEMDMGESNNLGVTIPEELEKVVEQAQDELEVAADEEFTPGVLIPESIMDKVHAVADPEAFANAEEVRFDMVPFVGGESETSAKMSAHWVLFGNGEPLAKINLQDQKYAEKIASHFITEDFARSVVESITAHGLKKTLTDVNARAYVASVDQSKIAQSISARLSVSAEEQLRQKLAATKQRFQDNLGLALKASSTNFLVANALKDALIAEFSDMGIPEEVAAQKVDQAYFRAGPKTLASILDQAEEWSSTPVEAMKTIKAAVENAGIRSRPLPSQLTAAADRNPGYNQELANQLAGAAVPATPEVKIPLRSPTPVSAKTTGESPAAQALRARLQGFRS